MRTTRVLISESNLRHNLNCIQQIAPDSAIMAIVKANAYGHSIVECSTILQNAGVEYFGVAFPSEAVKLRESGIVKPILVLVTPHSDELEVFCKHRLELIANSITLLKELDRIADIYNTRINAHLFINTGMNRDGILPSESIGFMQKSRELKRINIIGLCTHLATSEEKDTGFALEQLKVFDKVINDLEAEDFNFKYIHAANSAGAINFPNPKYNMIRPGISLYGYNTSELYPDKLDLKPVMSLRTSVLRIIQLNKGDSVGYGRKYIAKENTRICTIPIGYGDGYPYSFDGRDRCIINNKLFPIVGSICMDQSMVEIGNENINEDDEVILIGDSGNLAINAVDLAERHKTIPYNILTSILERVPRIFVENF